MDEPLRDADTTKGPDGAGDEHRMPGWVKGFVIAGIVVAVVIVAALLFGRGDHGPGRHGSDSPDAEVEGPADHTPPADLERG